MSEAASSRDVITWLESPEGEQWTRAVKIPVRCRSELGMLASVEPQPRGLRMRAYPDGP